MTLDNIRVCTIFMIIISIYPEAVWLCVQQFSNTPLNGFYCGGQNHTANGNNAKGSCKLACITSTTCFSVSFNPVTKTCVLSEVPCVTATSLNGFELMIFRDKQDVNCAVWVPDEPGVLDNNRLLYVKNNGVGRVSVNGDLLVGRADKPGENWNTYIPQPSTDSQIWYGTEELLTVHPDCTMAWVPHTAVDILHPRSIATGMLADGRRLYTIRALHPPANIVWCIDVYTEGDTAGYFDHGGSNTVTKVWDFGRRLILSIYYLVDPYAICFRNIWNVITPISYIASYSDGKIIGDEMKKYILLNSVYEILCNFGTEVK